MRALSDPPGGRAGAVLRVLPTVPSDRETAVRALYEAQHVELVRFATFIVGDVHAAEDVTQEAFIRVYDAWDRLEDHRSRRRLPASHHRQPQPRPAPTPSGRRAQPATSSGCGAIGRGRRHGSGRSWCGARRCLGAAQPSAGVRGDASLAADDRGRDRDDARPVDRFGSHTQQAGSGDPATQVGRSAMIDFEQRLTALLDDVASSVHPRSRRRHRVHTDDHTGPDRGSRLPAALDCRRRGEHRAARRVGLRDGASHQRSTRRGWCRPRVRRPKPRARRRPPEPTATRSSRSSQKPVAKPSSRQARSGPRSRRFRSTEPTVPPTEPTVPPTEPTRAAGG